MSPLPAKPGGPPCGRCIKDAKKALKGVGSGEFTHPLPTASIRAAAGLSTVRLARVSGTVILAIALLLGPCRRPEDHLVGPPQALLGVGDFTMLELNLDPISAGWFLAPVHATRVLQFWQHPHDMSLHVRTRF